ncbi:phage holin [Halalkalibacillus halophilus]|uniref:phage holin n=1 Tax=Halalkalibacillus halophilus TaxID=392827 RepID=UPI00040346E4|nr:phage holin [Halalkalibacillus halophilus]
MDRGTLIRSIVFLIILINQALVLFGKSPLPYSNEQLEAGVTALVTTTVGLWAWFKNNYVTEKGRQQHELLKKNKLSK